MPSSNSNKKKKNNRSTSTSTSNETSSKMDIKLLLLSAGLVVICVLALFIVVPKESKKSIETSSAPIIENNRTLRELLDDLEDIPENNSRRTQLYTDVYKSRDYSIYNDFDLKWMEESEVEMLALYAAHGYHSREELTKAEEIFRTFYEKRSKLANDIQIVVIDKLADIYRAQYKFEKAIEIYKDALDNRITTQFANRWYGFYIESLDRLNRLEEASIVIDECIDLHKSLGIFPFHCYHGAGMHAMFEGDLDTSLKYFFKVFRDLLQDWRDENGNACPATLVPLTVNTPYPAITKLRDETILEEPVDYMSIFASTEAFKVKPCSSQEYPYMLAPSNSNNEREVIPFVDSYTKMGCYGEDEQHVSIHLINDAMVFGEMYHISTKSEEGDCRYYVPSFPYLNSKSQPRLEGAGYEYFSKPIKEIENATILHFSDQNYYHFTIEALSKVILSRLHPILREIENLRFLTKPSHTAEELYRIMGVLPMAELYEPHKYRYRIKNLYLIEWNFTDLEQSKLNNPLLSKDGVPHFEEYYLPPVPVLQYTHYALRSVLTEDMLFAPRNLVIFLHRRGNTRAIMNPLPLYRTLAHACEKHGLEFRLHGFDDATISHQIEQFNRAVAIIGVHGAGLTNMIYCQKKTAIIELPVTPHKVSVYSRMASILNFPYYTVPKAGFYHFHSVESFTKLMTADTEATLYRALSDLGYEMM